jgi:hypothetical protein
MLQPQSESPKMPWRIPIPYHAHATHDAESLEQGIQSIRPEYINDTESANEDESLVLVTMDKEWELVLCAEQTDLDGKHTPSVQTLELRRLSIRPMLIVNITEPVRDKIDQDRPKPFEQIWKAGH